MAIIVHPPARAWRRGVAALAAAALLGIVAACAIDRAPSPAENEGRTAEGVVLPPPPNPDLVVKDVAYYAPHPEARAMTATLTFTIYNQGNRNALDPFRTSVTCGGTTQYVRTTPLGSLDSAYASITLPIPASHALSCSIATDVDGNVTEQSEANNGALAYVGIDNPTPGQWLSIGPRSIDGTNTGFLSSVVIDPTSSNVIWVAGTHPNGGADGSGKGIWKSTDAGLTWAPVANGLPTLDVLSIAIDPSATSTLYAATRTKGLFATTDGGASFRLVAKDQVGAKRIYVDPTNHDRLFILRDDAIYVSSDRGVTWSPGAFAGVGAIYTDLAIDPSSPTTLFAGVRHDTDAAIPGAWRSQDSGATWARYTGCSQLPGTTGEDVKVATAGGRVYVTYRKEGAFSVYAPTGIACSIGGVQEQQLADRTPSGVSDDDGWGGLFADPKNAYNVFFQGVQMWRSTDGGGHFAKIGYGGHGDHHAIAFEPFVANVLYTADDGGLHRSGDNGTTWTFRADGITSGDFYDLADRQQTVGAVGGLQDNGTISFDGYSADWDTLVGDEDGATVAISPSDESIVYGMGQFPSSIFRFVTAPPKACVGCGLPTTGCQSSFHFLVDPLQPTTVLASCGSLWRSTSTPTCSQCPSDDYPNGVGDPWNEQGKPAGTVIRTAVDAAGRVYYAATAEGDVYFSVGAVGTWTKFYPPAGQPDQYGHVTDIEIDPSNPTLVYATLWQQFGGGNRVVRFVRPNTPTSTMAITTDSIATTSLPEAVGTSQTVAVDAFNTGSVFVGTSAAGVWHGQLVNGTWQWSAYNLGLPPTQDVRALAVNKYSGLLHAATFGSGVFEVHPAYRNYTLTVAKNAPAGLDVGTITSSPSGVSCGSTCSASYAMGTSVTVTAHPPTGVSFTGWTGCDSSSGTTCHVRMMANRTLTGSFTCNHSACVGDCLNECESSGGTPATCVKECSAECASCP